MTEIKDEQRYIEVFSMTDEEYYRDRLYDLATESDETCSRIYGYAICILEKAHEVKLADKLKDEKYSNNGRTLFEMLIQMHDMAQEDKDLRKPLMDILHAIGNL